MALLATLTAAMYDEHDDTHDVMQMMLPMKMDNGHGITVL